MEHASTVDVGDRKRRSGGINEDSVATAVLENHHRETGRPVGVFVLGDGVGGEACGDVASFLATTVVRKRLTAALLGSGTDVLERFDVDGALSSPPTVDENPHAVLSKGKIRRAIQDGIDAAHQRIQTYARDIGARPATTIVAGVYADGTLHYGWVGDSRLYLLNTTHEEITQLTTDHAVTNAKLERGEIADEVYARVHEDATAITRAVGGSANASPTVDVEFGSTTVYGDDVIMLTSDGLIDAYPAIGELRAAYDRADEPGAVREEIQETLVTDDEILDIVLEAPDLQAAVADLVDFANDRGGKDNISITLARDPAADASPETLLRGAETVIEPADGRAENGSPGDGPDGTDGDEGGEGGEADADTTEAADADGAADANEAAASEAADTGDPSPDPESGGKSAGTDGPAVVTVGAGGSDTAAIAVPAANVVYEVAGTVTLGSAAAEGDEPDVPIAVSDVAVVETVHASVGYVQTDSEWRITDRSSSGTYVEVDDGEWLLLLSSEGLEFHRQSGFDPDAATERDIDHTTTLADGTAFVLEDPRHDEATTCRFYSSVERAREQLAEGTEESRFERFLT